MEEERFRAAVLRLPVEDLGLTVEQCLDEMCERIDSPADADVVRYHLLRDAIAVIGLRYVGLAPNSSWLGLDSGADLARPLGAAAPRASGLPAGITASHANRLRLRSPHGRA